MHKHLPERPKLLIVSDTAMRINGAGVIEAFEPVVREIENFEYLFGEIIWIGYDYSEEKNIKNMRSTISKKVRFVMLERTGGAKFWDKLKIFLKMFPYFLLILTYIFKNDVVHTRAPSMPAFLAILISFFDRKRVYWHKYAGNWNEERPPKFYGFQRGLLKKAKHTRVTINGHWPEQQKHLISFENPCLTNEEIAWISRHVDKRNFDGKLNFCFIGNVTEAKGVERIIEAFSELDLSRVGTVHFIGDGKKRGEYEAATISLPFEFHGFMLRSQMHEILNECQFLLLPSKSEGFPKVIAEVSPYGIAPIVSAVSAIPQYIHNDENGFLIDEVNAEALKKVLQHIIQLDKERLGKISKNTKDLYRKFSYEYYNQRIRKEVLEDESC